MTLFTKGVCLTETPITMNNLAFSLCRYISCCGYNGSELRPTFCSLFPILTPIAHLTRSFLAIIISPLRMCHCCFNEDQCKLSFQNIWQKSSNKISNARANSTNYNEGHWDSKLSSYSFYYLNQMLAFGGNGGQIGMSRHHQYTRLAHRSIQVIVCFFFFF